MGKNGRTIDLAQAKIDYDKVINDQRRKMKLKLISDCDSRNPWDAINAIIGSKFTRRLQPKDATAWNSEANQAQAREIGSTFHSISSNIAPCSFSPEEFLTAHPPEFPTFELWELKRALFKVHPKSAAGPDLLSVNALRKFYVTDPEHLLKVMQRSLEVFPNSWKSAWIHPIAKHAPGTYRPIALLSQLSKLLERMVTLHLDFLVETPVSQYGCAPGIDIELVLTKFHHHSLLKEEEHGLMLFFDIKKAFDRVNPIFILEKIATQNLPSWIISFLKQFLLKRDFKVRYKGMFSETFFPEGGIAQGSPLSPILWKMFFQLYFQIDSQSVQGFEFIFMDDLSILLKAKDPNRLNAVAQKY